MKKSWIRCIPGGKPNALALFCLAHAGGNSSLFKGWRDILPDDIDLYLITLPGRHELLQQPMPDSINQLSSQLVDQLLSYINNPWAIFGHSMGAVIAHEVIIEVMSRNKNPPIMLGVSSREAPQFHHSGILHQQSDQLLCTELIRLGGTASELLEIDEMRNIILSTMRTDYSLIERWKLSSHQKIPCHICAFIGCNDPDVNEEQAKGWEIWSETGFTLDVFSGGHFYFNQCPQLLIQKLISHLRGIIKKTI
ncbi:thioesterase [Salmonella enterica]|uniref:thioesterase II family protein n=1 Tax=Salmonella enterica TaxID=28901 RepID=UPI0012819DB6|nr:thioesterase [Salmonella enterica]EBS5800725.1 thioesterase [Salmonella enterica subsp. enterica serovar Java]EDQ0183730.1 thioesterase [Salmonella enterica subsp. enterica serovar 4,[5],12:b:-]EEE5613432.1 thioesterase [Salmonella enterica subsp. enterica serovar Typhimurium]EKN5800817.1 thioesterase [Salmonella enterica subsp. enterica]